ncbi:MAG: response regulator [Candidatus Melainabacteria bacterium]|nr:response regulator [Candidatus Melainabacteria bacterium]
MTEETIEKIKTLFLSKIAPQKELSTQGDKSSDKNPGLTAKPDIKILLVDDNAGDIFLMKKMIEKSFGKEALKLDDAMDYQKAIDQLSKEKYDLAFFDFQLGQKNGLDLLEEIKKSNIQVPIVFLTGQGNEQVAVQAMKSGAIDYLLKSEMESSLFYDSITSVLGIEEPRKLEDKAEDKAAKKVLYVSNNTVPYKVLMVLDGLFKMDVD